jgi:hypothetical protein
VYRESVNLSGIVVSTEGNELVKVSPKAFELDCVFEVEEAVDPVPVLDASVVCCALANSVAINCNHINWLRMVVEVRGPKKLWNVLPRVRTR